MLKKEKHLTKKRFSAVILFLAVLLGVLILLCPVVGTVNINIKDALAGYFSGKTNQETEILMNLRLPRVLLAALVGACLAVTGCVFQALLRNPLATPYILGISSGGSFGVVLFILFGWTFTIAGIPSHFFAAFGFSLLSVFFVYWLSKVKGNLSTSVMLLSGVTINFFFASAILLVQYLSNPSESFRMIRWMMGGVDAVDYLPVRIMLIFGLPGIIILMFFSKQLNLIAADVVFAAQIGVNVDITRKVCFFIASIITAACLSVCGPIGFVGLIIPHLIRLAFGSDNRLLLPASALFGASFLLLCDTLARSLGRIVFILGGTHIFGSGFAQVEIPVGVITSMCGAPFFIFLLLKKKGDGVIHEQ